jgi:RNA polymerase primary sigma factor
MASKAKEVVVKQKEKERTRRSRMGAAETTDTLLPLLDLSDAAVKRLIRIAKKRGYVTHDEVKSLSEELNSEQIEDGLAMFSKMRNRGGFRRKADSNPMIADSR